jgi:hypothetical protein
MNTCHYIIQHSGERCKHKLPRVYSIGTKVHTVRPRSSPLILYCPLHQNRTIATPKEISIYHILYAFSGHTDSPRLPSDLRRMLYQYIRSFCNHGCGTRNVTGKCCWHTDVKRTAIHSYSLCPYEFIRKIKYCGTCRLLDVKDFPAIMTHLKKKAL